MHWLMWSGSSELSPSVDQHKGEEGSGGRHSPLQFLEVWMWSLQDRTSHPHRNRKEPDYRPSTHWETQGELCDSGGSLREDQERDDDTECSCWWHKAREGPRLRNQNHWYFSFAQPCDHKVPKRRLLCLRQQVKVRDSCEGGADVGLCDPWALSSYPDRKDCGHSLDAQIVGHQGETKNQNSQPWKGRLQALKQEAAGKAVI